jgi:WD40 repeat protein
MRRTGSEARLPYSLFASLKGHTEIVYAIDFSPDGKYLLTGSFDKTLKLWEGATGKEIKTFDGPGGHRNLVLSVAFSPDGRTLASGSSDNTAKLWDTEKAGSAGPIKNLAHPNLVDAVAFHPAGRQLATGCHDGSVRIWDVAKGQQVRQIRAHTVPMMTQIYCVSWNPNGKQIVSGSLDRSLKLWDAATGNLIREFKGYSEIAALPVLGASTVALLGSPLKQAPFLTASAVLPGRTGKYVEKGHREGVFCAAFSPDGKLLASGSSDHTIKLWKVADATLVREFINPKLKTTTKAGPTVLALAQAHPGWVYGVRFTPEGDHLVSVGNAPRNRGYLAVWNVADGKLLYGEELPLGAIYSVAISPDGKRLALACGPNSRQVPEGNGYLIRMPYGD